MHKPNIITCSKYFRDNPFTESALLNNELYFAPLSSLNDPYENLFSIAPINYSEIVVRYSDFEVTLKEKDVLEQYYEHRTLAFRALFNEFGVCCFTKYPQNFLMWSHYADAHKGMCFLFDFKEDKQFLSMLDKVNYQNDIIDINLFSKDNIAEEKGFIDKYLIDQIIEVVYTKSTIWSYEEELRMMVNGHGVRKFNPKCLKFVILGYAMNEKRKEELVKLINSKYSAVKILECVLFPQFQYMKFQDWETKEMVMFEHKR